MHTPGENARGKLLYDRARLGCEAVSRVLSKLAVVDRRERPDELPLTTKHPRPLESSTSGSDGRSGSPALARPSAYQWFTSRFTAKGSSSGPDAGITNGQSVPRRHARANLGKAHDIGAAGLNVATRLHVHNLDHLGVALVVVRSA